MDVGDTAIRVSGDVGLLQNLGPDAVFIGGPTVTSENGFRVGPGLTVAVGARTMHAISEGESDVRYLGSGVGLFGTETTPPE